MGATEKQLSKGEANLCKLYHALLEDDEIPSTSAIYAPYEDLSDVAAEMFSARAMDGTAGLKKYIANLSKIKDSNHKRLIKILSNGSLEAEDYAGTLLSEVAPQKISWLWKHRLALGKITTLDGDPGLGKSLIGANVGAAITTGGNMPDGSPCLATGGVVVIMPEDGLEDTIQPRFARAGANLNKILDLSTVRPEENEESRRPFLLQHDLKYLDAAIRRVDAKLVYIDPIMAVIGGNANTYKDNEVRALLMPLKTLVEKRRVSCVVVRHMTKVRGENPLMAGGGSISFAGLARTGLMVVRNPDDPSQVILSHIKSNIGPIAPGITYTVCSDEAEGDDRPYIVWGEETMLSGLDLMSTPHKNTGGNRQAILDLLKERSPEEMTPQEIAKEMPEMGCSNLKMTLKRMYDNGEIAKSERGAYHAK